MKKRKVKTYTPKAVTGVEEPVKKKSANVGLSDDNYNIGQRLDNARAELTLEKERIKPLPAILLKNAKNKDVNNIPTRTDLGWIKNGKYFCSSHTCELLDDSGYTIPQDFTRNGRTYKAGDGIPLLPGNASFQEMAPLMGFKKVSKSEGKAGDVVQMMDFMQSDYQGNPVNKVFPHHNMIQSEIPNKFYQAPGGMRSNYNLKERNLKPDQYQGWHYEGNVPQLEKNFNDAQADFRENYVPMSLGTNPIEEINPGLEKEIIKDNTKERVTEEIANSNMSDRKKKKAMKRLGLYKNGGIFSAEEGAQVQPQDVMQIVQQLTESGANVLQIAGTLVNQGIPPQEVMEVLIQSGFPEQEAGPAVQEALQGQPQQGQPQQQQQQQPQQPQQQQEGQPMMEDGGPVDTGEGILEEDNFIKTRRKFNGKIKQKEISEKRFNRIQDRYERHGGYDGGDNPDVDNTVHRMGNKSVSNMVARDPQGLSKFSYSDPNDPMGGMTQEQIDAIEDTDTENNFNYEYSNGDVDASGPPSFMANGGNVGGVLFDGNTIDFNEVRKNLIKMYKSGGQTKESDLDPTSIGSYTQGLKNKFEKTMFLGNAIGKVQNRFKDGQGAPNFKNIPQQQEMPMAENGILISADGIPTWDGEELPQFIKDKYNIETKKDLDKLIDEGANDWWEIVDEINKGIFNNSEYGQRAAELGYTFDQVAGEGYDPAVLQSMTQAMEPFVASNPSENTINNLATNSVQNINSNIAPQGIQPMQPNNTMQPNNSEIERLEPRKIDTSYTGEEELQDLNVPGYVNGVKKEVVPTVRSFISNAEIEAEEAIDIQKEEERRAALTQAERNAEDKKNTETEYEEGKTYKYVDGKLTLVEEDGDSSQGQADDPNRVKTGWNANGTGKNGGKGTFLDNMAGILSRRQVGVQGNMKPEDFYNSFGNNGGYEVDYRGQGIFGREKGFTIKWNPVTQKEEAVDQEGNVVTDETGNAVDPATIENEDIIPLDAVESQGLSRRQQRNRTDDTDQSGNVDKWERRDGRIGRREGRREDRRDRREGRREDRQQSRIDRRFGSGYKTQPGAFFTPNEEISPTQNLSDAITSGNMPPKSDNTFPMILDPLSNQERVPTEREISQFGPVYSKPPTTESSEATNNAERTFGPQNKPMAKKFWRPNPTSPETDAIRNSNDRLRQTLKETETSLEEYQENPQLQKAIDEYMQSQGGLVKSIQKAKQFKYGGLTQAVNGMNINQEYQNVAKFKPLYETTIDLEAGANASIIGGNYINEIYKNDNELGPLNERTDQRSTESTIGVYQDAKNDAGREGLYRKNTGELLSNNRGASLYSGTNVPTPGNKGQSFDGDILGRGSDRMRYAKEGLQVGKEITLTPGQLKMMENLGFKVTQLY